VESSKLIRAFRVEEDIRVFRVERVGIIIGSNAPKAHWVLDQRRGGRKEPYAVKTLLAAARISSELHSKSRKRSAEASRKNDPNGLK
jgi:hypothetical protein